MGLKIIVTGAGCFVGEFDEAIHVMSNPLQVINKPQGNALVPVIYAPEGQAVTFNPDQIIYWADPNEGLMRVYEESIKNLSAARANIQLAKDMKVRDGVIQFIKH